MPAVHVHAEAGRPAAIARVTLLHTTPPLLRFDVLPFALLYAALAAALCSVPWSEPQPADAAVIPGVAAIPIDDAHGDGDGDGDSDSGSDADAFHPSLQLVAVGVAFGAVLLAHVVVLLSEFWSAVFRARVAFRPAASFRDASHVVVVPMPHCGAAAIAPLLLHRDGAAAAGSPASFDYQNARYCADPLPEADRHAPEAAALHFRPLQFPCRLPIGQYMTAKGYGTHAAAEDAAGTWGANKLTIPLPQYADLMLEQALAPFFVFQIVTVLLWMLDDYWYYSVVTLAMLVFLESTVAKQRIQHASLLRSMRRHPHPVFVYRESRWTRMDSTVLLPGDIVSLSRRRPAANAEQVRGAATGAGDGSGADTCPADVLLLRGKCVVNEAMLTGESVPQMKHSVADLGPAEMGQPLAGVSGTDRRHVSHLVFGGTDLVQCDNDGTGKSVAGIPQPPDRGCLAYVLRTGFYTSQGNLMRTIIFSTQRVTASNKEAFHFILILLVFALAASGYVLHAGLQQSGRSLYKLLLHCVMIVVSVVPPELPIELAMAVNVSITNLIRVGVYCTEPFRVPFAGRIDVCCFDKTGTLTSDDLDVQGVAFDGGRGLADGKAAASAGAGAGAGAGPASNTITPAANVSSDAALVLGACHSLSRVRDTVLGDPLERAVSAAAGWTVLPDGTCRPAGGRTVPASDDGSFPSCTGVRVVRRWPFSSAVKRMCVAVTPCRTNATGRRLLFKGAPEMLEPLLTSVPAGYTAAYRKLMLSGNRVLALATRDASSVPDAEFEAWTRADAESDLVFVGFLVLSTPVKHDSASIIKHLTSAKHATAMITGDNALTAVAVARQVRMLPRTVKETFLLDVASSAPDAPLQWSLLSAGKPSAASVALFGGGDANAGAGTGAGAGAGAGVTTPSAFLVRPFKPSDVMQAATTPELSYAVSGPALQWFIDRADAEPALLRRLCTLATVFARVSPTQKERIITTLNSLGRCTLMCGDGVNDVGALKQAHVGVSIISDPKLEKLMGDANRLAKAASKASGADRSDLNSQVRRLVQEHDQESAVVKLGDASIASPFTAKNPSIKTTVEIIKQGRCALVTTHQMYKILAINCLVLSFSLSALYLHGVKSGDTQATLGGLSVAAFFLMLSWAKPMKKLAPVRPYSSVFNTPLMVSVLGQFAIHLAVLFGVVNLCLPHLEPVEDLDGPFTPNIINSAMFLVTMTMQVATFACNYQGHPFMQSLSEHKLLGRSLAVVYGVVVLAALEVLPPELFEMVPLPDEAFRYTLLGYMLADTIGAIALDRVVRKLFSRV